MKSDTGQSAPFASLLTPPGRKWNKAGHPWLYRTHLKSAEALGDAAGFCSWNRESWAYSPLSEIRLRRAEALDGLLTETGDAVSLPGPSQAPAIVERLSRLWQQKRSLVGHDECFRWVFSEVDGWPGLVVDVFGFDLVAQIQTAPMEAAWRVMAPALIESARKNLSKDPKLHEIRSTPARKREGLQVVPLESAKSGEGDWYKWNGLEWWFHPGRGQKTGAYLDQRENHRQAVQWAQRRQVRKAWDVFSFEGGFGLHLARAGIGVEAVDQSAAALEVARKNAARNAIPEASFRTIEANAFDWLKARSESAAPVESDSPQLIVLDPPSFVRNRKDKDSALRGLKEINLRALKALAAGGLLVSCSCSHHISREDYGSMLASAASDARCRGRVLEVRGPSGDHGSRLGFPESEYLQAWIVEVLK